MTERGRFIKDALTVGVGCCGFRILNLLERGRIRVTQIQGHEVTNRESCGPYNRMTPKIDPAPVRVVRVAPAQRSTHARKGTASPSHPHRLTRARRGAADEKGRPK